VVTTLRRLPFSSDLRRMSVVVDVQSGSDVGDRGGLGGIGSSLGPARSTWVLAKGAPEAVGPLLAELPPHFEATYLRHMGKGLRVLCLAYKRLDAKRGGGSSNGSGSSGDSRAAALRAARAEVEGGLTFAGFALLDCPLKRDSAEVVGRLQASGHR
jgi:cation-transporting ATPase 13A1